MAHWLELEVTKELAGKDRTLVMGAEMFETDNQLLLDEYFSGRISQSNFEKEARLWDNYKTDYKHLLEFARQQKIRFVATNIPRRYASIVSRQGFKGLDSLSAETKSYMPPLPVDYDPELPGYKNMRELMGAHSEMGVTVNPEFFPQAQAIKDATMAYFILKNLPTGQRFLHFNGAYHSNNFEGIVWYLKKARPDLNILTINTVEQDDPETLTRENRHTADYIIAVPSDMTKTF